MPGRIFRCAKCCAEVLPLAVFYENEAEQRKKHKKHAKRDGKNAVSLICYKICSLNDPKSDQSFLLPRFLRSWAKRGTFFSAGRSIVC